MLSDNDDDVPLNISSPSITTLLGTVTAVNAVQSAKALSAIVTTLLGILTDANDVHPLNPPIYVRPVVNVIEVNVVIENALLPILVTLLGIIIDVSEVHESKALLPIVVTVVGM